MKNVLLLAVLSLMLFNCHKPADPYNTKQFTDLRLEHELIKRLGANVLTNYHDYDIIKEDEKLVVILNKKNNISLMLVTGDSMKIVAKMIDNERGVNYTFKKDKTAEILEFYKNLLNVKENEKITILYNRLENKE